MMVDVDDDPVLAVEHFDVQGAQFARYKRVRVEHVCPGLQAAITSPVARSADHMRLRAGCSTLFHDCGPAECANAARSARSRSR